MTNEDWKQLIDKYFEAETTPEEERLLAHFLSTTDDPAYDEVKAVMGYFRASAAALAKPAPARISFRRIGILTAVAASVALVVITGIGYSRQNVCVTYAYGVKQTDREVVLSDVRSTITELFCDNQGPDVAAQLDELFK